MSTTSSLNLADNLLLNGLTRPEVRQRVINVAFGFNSINDMVNKTSKGHIEVQNDKFFTPYLGNTAISGVTTGSPSLSGSNLIMTVSASEDRIRLKDVVMDAKTRVQGRVVAINGNLITLQPLGGVTFNASVHFLNGVYFSVISDASGARATGGKTSLSQVFSQDYGVLAKVRDNYSADTIDRLKTEVTFPAGQANGIWFTSQQMFLLQRVMRFIENDLVFSEREYGLPDPVDGGTLNRTGGIRWTARTNSRSTYLPLSSNPSFSDLEDLVYEFKSKKAQSGQSVRVIDAYVGAQMLRVIQTAISSNTNLLYAGTENTFGVKAGEGNNVYMMTVAGVKVRINEYPAFNNRGLFGQQISAYTGLPMIESSVILIDWDGAESVDGGGKIATIQPYKFKGVNPMQMYINPGIDQFSEYLSGGSVQSGKVAFSDLDAANWGVYSYQGYYIIPENVAMLELIA